MKSVWNVRFLKNKHLLTLQWIQGLRQDDQRSDQRTRDNLWQFVEKFFGCEATSAGRAECPGHSCRWRSGYKGRELARLHVVCGWEAGWIYCQGLRGWRQFGHWVCDFIGILIISAHKKEKKNYSFFKWNLFQSWLSFEKQLISKKRRSFFLLY